MAKRRRSGKCGKRCYDNKTQAVAAAIAIGRRLKYNMRAYKCCKCGAWHIGSGKWAHVAHVQQLIDEVTAK